MIFRLINMLLINLFSVLSIHKYSMIKYNMLNGGEDTCLLDY